MCGLAVQGPKMAAGSGASSGQSRGLPVALESTLDRRFQGVSNTMESIQGLSNWCIENKKYHSLVVRYWIKWLRKSEASHRLNLFYLANDVIQNCKRRNAIVYRTAFADVLPEAFQLVNNVGDSKVMKSVDRILTIWEERSVYTEQLIAELRASLVKEDSPAAVETPKAPVNPKAALQSKIVAEFVPQAFIDHLSKYHSSVEEVVLKEKQLAAMRVDVCSTEALKRLKDKAGGKRHSKDFEDGSAKLKEFVAFLDRQVKGGPPLLDALGNADIFYEMQYKEVKIVANAYKMFANRVSHLKRKLDSLKATLPDLDESPIPSPSMDAPSPNGSESPFHGLADPDSDLDGLAMDDEADITLGEAPSPLSSPGGSPKQGFAVGESDNRDVEDMELSDEEAESISIIVEDRVESPIPSPVPIPVPVVTQPPLATEAKSVPQATPSPALLTPLTPTTNISGNLANVDLGKISSILSSITSVMKKPGVSPGGSLVSPSPAKTAPVAPQVASPLASILSKVDMTPHELFSALSESQGQASGLQGLSTRLNSPAGNLSSNSPSTGKLPHSASTPTVSSRGLPLTSSTLEPTPSAPAVGNATAVPQAASLPQSTLPLAIGPHRGLVLEQKEEKPSASSLESKIHCFLQGNPGFNAFNLGLTSVAIQAGGSDLSPLAGTETQGGTPVRDEAGGGTPTLDEIMDTPGGAEPFLAKQRPVSGVPKPEDGSLSRSPTACHNQVWQDPNNTHGHLGLHPGAPNGQGYHQLPYEGKEEMHGIAPSLRESGLAHYQPITTQVSAPTLGEGLLSNTPGGPHEGPNADVSEGGWYGNPYPEGQALHPSNHHMAASGAGDGKTPISGPYAYQGEGQTQPYQTRDPHALPFQQGANPSSFLNSPLPPIPQLPPPPFPGIPAPPQDYQGQPASVMVPVEGTSQNPEIEDDRAGVSTLGGPVIISDPYHPDDFRRHPDVLHRHADDPYHPGDFHRHPDDLHGHSDDLLRQPDDLHHLDDFHRHPDDLRRHPHDLCHPDDRYYHPDDFHRLPVDDPHYPYRVGERLTPTLSPSEDPYYYNYPPRSPSPPYGHRRPLPPHMNLHHPDHMPLPPRPLHLAHHPHLRGLPRGPTRPPLRSPMFRGKRPGPPFGGHPRGGGPGGPFFPPKRPHLPPRF